TDKPNDETYEMLINDKILDDSGKRDEIAAKYGDCYTKTMGELLTEDSGQGGDDAQYVVRKANGDIDPDHGLCSQKNLSLNNPEYGELAFRWRVSKDYDAFLAQSDEQQNPTTDTPSNNGNSGNNTN